MFKSCATCPLIGVSNARVVCDGVSIASATRRITAKNVRCTVRVHHGEAVAASAHSKYEVALTVIASNSVIRWIEISDGICSQLRLTTHE